MIRWDELSRTQRESLVFLAIMLPLVAALTAIGLTCHDCWVQPY
jgi:uncharacterized membrane protein YqaE (UPF0057 family)